VGVKSQSHHALPAELTSFVGRRHQMAQGRRMLSDCRLVTLTGVGGVGKTRLALRIAASTRRSFPDGVWLVLLAPLSDPQLLPHTIAAALGLHQESEDPLSNLAEHLEDKQLLVVLDNCEHLTGACAVVVTKLLAAAPGLRVLATSRHALDVEGEQVLGVPPLATPVDGAPSWEPSHYESVDLFVERARAMDPAFDVTEENRAAVVELCRRLDGLPLALELAAVWVRALTPAEILDRLDDRFELLTSGRRGGAPRHQALDAAIDWSFELCSPGEQLLWARLSVFSGGFDLDGAETVGAGDGIDREDVLELLGGLVGKSIVVRQHDVENEASWYSMLETIRQYGARRLSAGEPDAVRRRHRDHYRRLAEGFDAEFFGPRQAGWYLRLRREHGNIRAAIEFCLGQPGEAGDALGIAAPLWPWWHAGHIREGLQYLTRALELAAAPSRSRGYGLLAASNLAIRLSEFDRALALLAESGGLADRFGDELLSARVKQCHGHALLHSGRSEEAVPLLEAARDDARRLGQPRDEWRDLNLLSLAMMFLGDERAEDLARQAVALAGEHGAQASMGWALRDLGLAQWRAGRFQDASQSLRDGIRLFRSMRNLDGVSVCVQALSWCTASSSPDEHAARLMGVAAAVWSTIGGNVSQAVYREFDRQSEEQLRSAIGGPRFEAAFAEGAACSLDEALAVVLDGSSAHSSASAVSQAQAATPGGLTPREWEIAQLLADGLSNKAIATRLFISQRTAETHVENTLTKLGFTSRTQVARWAIDQRGR
jgi:predicted ATPase/DNA-binding NarL/FixJ family response regulator